MQLIGELAPDRPLVVVAMPEEAAYLGTDLPVLVMGVGKVCAAIAVTWALSGPVRPCEIINLGTAGALRAGLSGTNEIGLILQHDFDGDSIQALVGRAYGAPLRLADSGLALATGDVFVSDPQQAAALAERADLVDMEGYAVAAAALSLGVPVTACKHVSDSADGQAVKSWTSTVAECSRALGVWLAGYAAQRGWAVSPAQGS
ncbi:nucleosidase [Allorhizocola rhizosphaerae]|uniref:nucleosidase n=1 Tax=Allorhizocola rhizosphaerae TaxID=1872709 RepID=UPI000E3E1518|nr:nucleosidase [Allorhizocola rhizosphaerae]